MSVLTYSVRNITNKEGSSRGRTRTCDPPVNSRLLYQLSYSGKSAKYRCWLGGRQGSPPSPPWSGWCPVHKQPVESQLLRRLGELHEVHRFAHVTVGPK